MNKELLINIFNENIEALNKFDGDGNLRCYVYPKVVEQKVTVYRTIDITKIDDLGLEDIDVTFNLEFAYSVKDKTINLDLVRVWTQGMINGEHVSVNIDTDEFRTELYKKCQLRKYELDKIAYELCTHSKTAYDTLLKLVDQKLVKFEEIEKEIDGYRSLAKDFSDYKVIIDEKISN